MSFRRPPGFCLRRPVLGDERLPPTGGGGSRLHELLPPPSHALRRVAVSGPAPRLIHSKARRYIAPRQREDRSSTRSPRGLRRITIYSTTCGRRAPSSFRRAAHAQAHREVEQSAACRRNDVFVFAAHRRDGTGSPLRYRPLDSLPSIPERSGAVAGQRSAGFVSRGSTSARYLVPPTSSKFPALSSGRAGIGSSRCDARSRLIWATLASRLNAPALREPVELAAITIRCGSSRWGGVTEDKGGLVPTQFESGGVPRLRPHAARATKPNASRSWGMELACSAVVPRRPSEPLRRLAASSSTAEGCLSRSPHSARTRVPHGRKKRSRYGCGR